MSNKIYDMFTTNMISISNGKFAFQNHLYWEEMGSGTLGQAYKPCGWKEHSYLMSQPDIKKL